MSVQQISTGKFIDGEEVFAIELTNSKGTYVKIFNYGAIINQFIVENINGEKQDIVLGFDTLEQYTDPEYLKEYPYIGAVIGRYANRIKGGKFTVGAENYQLALNTADSTLHGGLVGFDRKVWDIIEIEEDQNAVTLQYESIDGEEHFPGNLVVDLTFQLTENNELILSYEAETDAATPINLTHHGYFNLSPTGGNVSKHQQQIFASNYLEQDEGYSVTGKLIPVAGTPLDFTSIKEIGKDWNESTGYDQSFVLDKIYGDLSLASKTTEMQSGLTLSVYTTEPIAHLYTGKYLEVKNGKGGRDYGSFEGFCVETQHHPNAVNIPSFPNTILQPEDLYTQTTIYKVSLNK
ncbi:MULTISPECIES: aldose epimerase family protein [unclassified Pedobacter]|jgi:aldose 1-epimerase|uniref:aldose epimerase family protein n=1 Tax=unclassified Pedobacter TaxID=2628915 RepID=UPI000B4B8C9F|nr:MULTISPECIES: aldose epimerase family protein [unclassified Pedobacter]MCX2430092.1 galactose mutarotase [Pedobacter sp. GR22-10]OWK70423.1 galactose-1-epimerase [Pedobacter sp. AJM]